MVAVRRLYQHARWRASGSGMGGWLLGLLRHVPWRQRRAFAEEEIFHVLGHQILRFLLPGHEPVLVQDHLHPILPELPGVRRNVLVNSLTELPGPWRVVQTWQFLLKLGAYDLAPGLVSGGLGRLGVV